MSALVGVPVILYLIWYGGLPLSVAVYIVALLGIFEMYRLFGKTGATVWMPGAVLGGTLFVAAAHIDSTGFQGAAFFITIAACLIYLISVYPSFRYSDLTATLFTSLYAGWLLSHLISLRNLPDGFHYVLLVLIATWMTDTMAYFAGINLGRHRLAPALSPKKSVEGALGGVAGSILAALAVGIIKPEASIAHYAVIGLLVGIVGQAGDLAQSALKRMAGVKDSGSVIPGHGGILDRFDSLLVTAPAVYYYLTLFVTK